MKTSMLFISFLLFLTLSILSCKSGSKDIPVDNPTIIDKAPKFETVKNVTGNISKADKVALKSNGNPELKGVLTNYNRTTKSLDVYNGKPKLLGFWASWCGPCIKEKPFFKQLSIKYPGIQFLSISIDEEMSWAQDYFRDRRIAIEEYDYWIGYGDTNPLKWYTLRALDDGTGNAAIISLPTYVLIDKNGKIISNDLPSPSTGGMQAFLDKMYLANE